MISENIKVILGKIDIAAKKSGRRKEDIIIVGITKGIPANKIIEAIGGGIIQIGESKIQEAEQKLPQLTNYVNNKGINFKFHMVGHLQTNKVDKALKIFDMIQSVDSLRLAQRIHEICLRDNKYVDALIEVNSSGEVSKFGVTVDEALPFLRKMCDFERIRVRGLMTMAPFVEDKQEARPYFRKLRQLRDQIQEVDDPLFNERIKMDFLSMGMSQDYEVAVEEGANMMRIGTALFKEKI